MLKAFRDLVRSYRHSSDLRARFTVVHDKNLWGNEETRSGWGSQRGSSSVAIAGQALLRAVHQHGVRSINDIPCGDFNWMPEVLAQIPFVTYTGFDIVKTALVRNKGQHPEREFRVLDITSRAPPAADLIFCKDLLNHLSHEDVKRAIANMRRSRSTFLLASNNEGLENLPLPHEDPSGSRHLDITAPPFNFRPPMWTLGGYMGLWALADMGECGF